MGKKKIPQLDSDSLYKMGKAERVQQSQIFDLQGEVQDITDNLDILERKQTETYDMGKELLEELEGLLEEIDGGKLTDNTYSAIEEAFSEYEKSLNDESDITKYDIFKAHEIITHNNWDRYYENLSEYGAGVGIEDDEDPFLTALSIKEYEKLDAEVNAEFAKKTSIKNKIDLSFLAIAVALEVAKGLLYPMIAEKAGYGNSFNPEDRLHHNDKSIEQAHKKANDEYRDKNKQKNGQGKWIEFLYRTVPYDITKGTGEMPDVNLHGGAHRQYTLGHDPILGWIFGTANILTDAITISPGAIVANGVSKKKLASIMKMAGIRTCRVSRNPVMHVTQERISMLEMFQESYKVIRENPMNLPAAIFTEGQHLKSDINTKMGLPVPAVGVFNPDFASKLYSNNYDALCFARDLKIVGESAIVSIIIDTVIGLIHGLYYNPQKDGTRELYEVRTRKILLIANTIGTSSNLIFSFFSKRIKTLDIGGLIITLSHVFMDTRFLLKVKKEFVENRLYEKIEDEIKELDNIEQKLIGYGEQHRRLYCK